MSPLLIPKPVQIPNFMCGGTTVIELREFNDKKKKKKRTTYTKCRNYILPKKWKFEICATLITCVFIKSQVDLKLKTRSEFLMCGRNKNHSNPYTQGTTIPCDTHCMLNLGLCHS